MATASPAWTKTWSRSPRRMARIPASPPNRTYAVNSSELPLRAPAIIARTIMTVVATPASIALPPW